MNSYRSRSLIPSGLVHSAFSAFGACRSYSMRTLVGGDAVAWTRPLLVPT
jgi:hypothetical protein